MKSKQYIGHRVYRMTSLVPKVQISIFIWYTMYQYSMMKPRSDAYTIMITNALCMIGALQITCVLVLLPMSLFSVLQSTRVLKVWTDHSLMLQFCGKVCLPNFENLSFIHHTLLWVILLLLILLDPIEVPLPAQNSSFLTIISILQSYHLLMSVLWFSDLASTFHLMPIYHHSIAIHIHFTSSALLLTCIFSVWE